MEAMWCQPTAKFNVQLFIVYCQCDIDDKQSVYLSSNIRSMALIKFEVCKHVRCSGLEKLNFLWMSKS